MTSPCEPASSPFDNTSRPGRVVILGTGGTIAGTAASADQHHAYQSAQLTVQDLVAAVPALLTGHVALNLARALAQSGEQRELLCVDDELSGVGNRRQFLRLAERDWAR